MSKCMLGVSPSDRRRDTLRWGPDGGRGLGERSSPGRGGGAVLSPEFPACEGPPGSVDLKLGLSLVSKVNSPVNGECLMSSQFSKTGLARHPWRCSALLLVLSGDTVSTERPA